MRKYNLQLELDKFDGLGDRLRLMEWIAYNVAQTIKIQKDVSYAYVVESLDNIALEVQNYLKEKHHDHSIFSTSVETFSYWKSNNIYNNHWNEVEGIQLIDTLNEYMFSKLNFRPCKVDDTNLEYMCIDNVLKSRYGQEMILLIIYHSVARRLGLRSDIIRIPGRPIATRCIYWKSKYGTINPKSERCFSFISETFPDCLVNKLYHWESQHPIFKNSVFRESFDETARIRMRHDLMLRVVDLTYHYNNTSQINERNKIYLHCNSHCKIKKLRLKQTWEFIRTEDVKFAVGMIVTHRDDCRNCDGVIIGWDRPTDRRYEILTHHLPDTVFDGESNRTIEIALNFLPLNHCHNYEFRKNQTNYIILTDKNKICYVNEDKLTLAAPKWIDNYEIGRYFCRFENTHYVPNEMLTKLYPEDDAIMTERTISSNPINTLTLCKRLKNIFRFIL
ncbi:uncharacterized protein LOC114935792 [Nylanderia fulva]|uniref:uncharacterized protein LOC114935792 n=1 Tax=Nylanderia fulva TaxID=613905 RepID=UPI0010FB6D86|nr:uncharacterized protein LOC114935792 [Nylanderia fulva]